MTQDKLRVVVGSDAAGTRYKEALSQDFAADDRVAEVIDVGVTADEILARPAVPQASATVAHGDTRAVKTTAARRPLPQHAMANQAKRRRWPAIRPPRMAPTMTPTPARAKGSAVSPAGRWYVCMR